MLWIELAGGVAPIIYLAKQCRYLVKPEHLIVRHSFRCKPEALQKLKRHPDKYQFAEEVRTALIGLPSIPRVYHVQRKRLRKIVLRNIQLSIVEKVNQ